jgi:hypothetical protein
MSVCLRGSIPSPLLRMLVQGTDLLVLVSCFDMANTYIFTKQATLIRRSTVLSRPLYLVFPGQCYLNKVSNVKLFKRDPDVHNDIGSARSLPFAVGIFSAEKVEAEIAEKTGEGVSAAPAA